MTYFVKPFDARFLSVSLAAAWRSVQVRGAFGSLNTRRTWTDRQAASRLTDKNLAAKGMTKYVKTGDGTYEKTAGTGPKKIKRK